MLNSAGCPWLTHVRPPRLPTFRGYIAPARVILRVEIFVPVDVAFARTCRVMKQHHVCGNGMSIPARSSASLIPVATRSETSSTFACSDCTQK